MLRSECKVLVVDDNAVDRLIVTAMLRKLKFGTVHEAEDGAIAENKILTGLEMGVRYDLIILDWTMPRSSGAKLLQWLSWNPRLAAIKTIVMTATSNRQVVQEAISAGTNDFIVKPVDLGMLEKKITELLD